ncbi:MAG: sulfur oxidation c-type cytochrome SoxA [Gammaproteobacteria bacterium]
MKKLIAMAVVAGITVTAPLANAANPQADLKDFRDYFYNKFPDTPHDDYINGIYSIDAPSREQWLEIEEFPPYEAAIDRGAEAWGASFANGKSYASCFGDDVSKIRGRYPYYDKARDEVITLELAINECRTANGEKPLKWKRGAIADLSSYIAFEGRGAKIDVDLSDPGAMKWYERGKEHFYQKRGQLNLSCADCHKASSGTYVRADRLSPALGHVSHFPVYRSKWGNMGTLHRRYGGCNAQVRFKPYKAQSPEYRALELFHTYMSQDLEWNGPGARK